MPSFRARVLDALDIEKKTIKLQVNETFPQIYKEEHSPGSSLAGNESACTLTNRVPYAVSKTIMNTTIGPNPIGGGAINPAASRRAKRKVESCKQQEADRAKTSVGKESEKTE